MAKNSVTRREALAGLSALTLAASALPAAALSGAQAEKVVLGAVADINRIIASGKSEGAMLRDFEAVFNRYADVAVIAQSALGPAFRNASRGEQRAFIEGFTDYFTRKYGRRFREFVGGQIEVNGSRAVKSFQEVRSTAKLRGQSPFNVVWLVSDRSGAPKIFNIIIEGVNTLQSERVEIRAMLAKRGGDVGRLASDLKRG